LQVSIAVFPGAVEIFFFPANMAHLPPSPRKKIGP